MIKAKLNTIVICLLLLAFAGNGYAQSVNDLRDEAKELREIGKYDDAIVFLLKALEKDPKNAEIEWLCANSYWKICFYSEALRYYEHIASYTNIALSYGNLGGVRAQMGYDDKAMEAINKAIELDADYIATYGNRGIINAYWYRTDDALADYEYASEHDPSIMVQTLINKAIVHHAIGNYEESERLVMSHLEYRESQPEAIFFLEEIRMLKDKNYKPSKKVLEKAADIYTSKIKTNRYDYYTYYERGKCYDLLGKKDLARKDFLSALGYVNEILDDMPDAWRFNRMRGILYSKLGEKEKARKDLEYVLSVNPGERSVQRLLARLNAK